MLNSILPPRNDFCFYGSNFVVCSQLLKQALTFENDSPFFPILRSPQPKTGPQALSLDDGTLPYFSVSISLLSIENRKPSFETLTIGFQLQPIEVNPPKRRPFDAFATIRRSLTSVQSKGNKVSIVEGTSRQTIVPLFGFLLILLKKSQISCLFSNYSMISLLGKNKESQSCLRSYLGLPVSCIC